MIRDLTYVGEGLIPPPLEGPALRYTPLPPGDVTDVVIHHMTGDGPPASASAEDEVDFLIGIDAYHRGGRGLDGIGYHLVPMASGRVYITSRLGLYGAHVGRQNNHLLGVALPGDYTSAVPTPQHLAATAEAVRYLYDYLGRSVPTRPHLAWGGTTCPGAQWPEWVPQLQDEALAEEDDGMTEEQAAMLQAILNLVKNEGAIQHRLRKIRDQNALILKAIEGIGSGGGGGMTPAELEALIKQIRLVV